MKKRYTFIQTVFLLFFISCAADSKQKATNFVVIFIDDMGYGDVACYGATGWETPNLDKLANEGMRFTNFYSAQPVCSASRAGLMTGCYPNRIGISGALFPQDSVGINPDEKTIAEILKEQGYTTGIFGKWHLGHHKKFLPLQNGFDEYVGLPYSNDMWPVDVEGNHLPEGKGRGNYPELPLMNGNEPVEYIKNLQDQDRLTTIYTEKAVDFINRNASKPFFMYVTHSMGHIPLGVSDKFRGKSKQGFYGDVMMEIDWSVGEIMKTMDQNYHLKYRNANLSV